MREWYQRYGGLIVVAALLVTSYFLLQPFLLPIISAAVIAYIFYPIYKKINDRIKKKNISSAIMCVVVLLIVIIPFLFVITSLIREIPGLYGFLTAIAKDYSTIMHSGAIEKLEKAISINLDFSSLISSALQTLLSAAKSIVAGVPGRIVSLSIAAVFLFFFFRDGDIIFEKIRNYLPFTPKDTIIILRELKQMTDAVVYGQIVTALAQSILATIGFAILGVHGPLFWGVMTFMFSLIPMIGPSIIYLPLSIALMLYSLRLNDSWGVVRGVILLGYGIGIISTIDNVLKPILISDRVSLHPALVLVGVLGGLTLFGVIGIVLGPLILVFLVTLINIYEMREDMLEHLEHSSKK